MKIAAIIGRFQVPYLHPGHLHLIATALRENDKVVILLGTTVSGRPDEKNPYGVIERIDMIQRIFPQVHIHVLTDMNSDEEWSKEVDWIMRLERATVIYHSRDSFKDHYHGKNELKEVEEIPGFSGTKLRESLK